MSLLSMFPVTANTKPEDYMYWNVTGENPYPEKQVEPNCMRRLVQYLRNSEIPLIKKVSLLFFAAFFTTFPVLILGHLLGQPLIVFTAVALGALLWGHSEGTKLDRAEANRIRAVREAEKALEEQRASLAKMKEAFGGEAAYNVFPNLDIGSRMGSTGYLDFLRPQDLTHPIMKGADSYGRPFVAIKVHLRVENSHFVEDHEDEAVVTIFQRYTTGGRWTYGVSAACRSFFNDVFNEQDWTAVRNLLAGHQIQRSPVSFTLAG